jgi:hypothetical protein
VVERDIYKDGKKELTNLKKYDISKNKGVKI